MVTVPALRVETTALRQRFEQRGFAAPVLTDKESHLAVKRQVDPVGKGADVERILGRIEFLWQALDLMKEW